MHVKELFLSSISFYASHLNREKIHLTSCLHGVVRWALLITLQSLAMGLDLHSPNSPWVQQELSFFPLGEWEADVALEQDGEVWTKTTAWERCQERWKSKQSAPNKAPTIRTWGGETKPCKPSSTPRTNRPPQGMIVLTGDAHIASNPRRNHSDRRSCGVLPGREIPGAPWGAEQSEGRTVLVGSTEALLI